MEVDVRLRPARPGGNARRRPAWWPWAQGSAWIAV